MKLLGFQFEYAQNSFWDKLAEAYSGTHDTLNSFIWYDELGNGKKIDHTLLIIGDRPRLFIMLQSSSNYGLPPIYVCSLIFKSHKYNYTKVIRKL